MKNTKVKLIYPPKKWEFVNLNELWDYREVLFNLSLRDIRLRYRQTILGILWVIIQPLALSLLFSIVFGYFADLPSNDKPYLVFVFAGYLPWILVSNSIQRAGGSLVKDVNLVVKTYIPRIIIPLSNIISAFLDFLISLVILIILAILFGDFQLNSKLLYFPFVVIVILLLSIGISVIISSLNVYYRDFTYTIPFILQFGFYASPIAYSSEVVSTPWLWIYQLNPMVGIIEITRWIFLNTGGFSLGSFLISFIICTIIFIVGLIIYKQMEKYFADVI